MNLGQLAQDLHIQASLAALDAFANAIRADAHAEAADALRKLANTPLLRVDCAAIKNGDGKIFSLPRPARHPAVVMSVFNLGASIDEDATFGFLLTGGAFVDRDRAAAIAVANGQCAVLSAPPYLYTDDLW